MKVQLLLHCATKCADPPKWLLAVAEVLHLVAVPQLGHFGFVLLALQMLPEVRLLLGSAVAHGAVELSAGSHAHGQVPGDALPRPGVVVRPCSGWWVRVEEEEAEVTD